MVKLTTVNADIDKIISTILLQSLRIDALHKILIDKGVCTTEELNAASGELMERVKEQLGNLEN